MNEINEVIQGISSSWSAVLLVGAAVIALANCFFGYRLLKLWTTLFGFLIGAIAGYYLGMHFGGNKGFALLAALVVGLFLAFISFWIYLVGVFLVCLILGTGITYLLIQPKSSFLFFVCMIVGVLVAVLAVKFVRPVVIISSALHGGLTIGALIVQSFTMDNKVIGYVIGGVMAILGMIYQFTRKPKELEDDEESEEEIRA